MQIRDWDWLKWLRLACRRIGREAGNRFFAARRAFELKFAEGQNVEKFDC